MRCPLARRFVLGLALAAMTALLPAEAAAQRAVPRGSRPSHPVAGRPPGGGGGGGHYRPGYYRPSYYRPYYYRPYYYRPYYPYYAGYYPYYGYYGYGYPYYRPYWNVGFSVGFGWGSYGAYGYPYAGYAGYWPYSYAYGGYYPPYDPMGEARLQVTPRNTEVYVNGYYAGVVDDFDGMSQRLRLAPGEHQVELYLDGHRPLQQKLMFSAGNTLRLRHTMEPLMTGEGQPPRPQPDPQRAAPPSSSPYSRDPGRPPVREPSQSLEVEPGAPGRYGGLMIRVQPADAEIVIDGEVWSSPDPRRAFVIQLPVGTHRVEVRKRGFSTYATEVTIRPGEPTTLNISLALPERL